ncbi:MAG TPA: 4Fe-4S dicluster domain-containing protein, partial [Gammaproteobacteria bacterium]|nr:4Fe-4S dicluster domain-containing protein [Gammaproteobacteria bacterium]
RLYPVLSGIKRTFDPGNRLNPGKIVTPDPSGSGVTAVDGVPFRGEFDSHIPTEDQARWAKALECNGNGVCFDWSATTTICPSYKVTRDRVHSPKGRADLLREWLRREAASQPVWGVDNQQERDRFAREVYTALHGCLGCKACASQCPVQVDIPTLRSRFLQRYHRRYHRPLRDQLIARIEALAPLLSWWPRFTNGLLQTPWLRLAIGRLAGLADFPAVAERSFVKRLAADGIKPSAPADILAASRRSGGKTVALLQDAFTSHFDADVAMAGYRLLKALGYDVHVLPYLPSGKAEHVRGFLTRFQRTGQRLLTTLRPLVQAEIPIIGIEPSIVLCLRQEYRLELGEAIPVQLIQEWLAEQALDALAAQAVTAPAAEYRLAPHCTEKTALPQTAQQWQRIFAATGLQLKDVPTGCCGMSGTYGHETEHQQESRQLYAMSWQEPVREYGQRLLATGFSCRCQAQRLDNQRLPHPLEVLVARLPEREMERL